MNRHFYDMHNNMLFILHENSLLFPTLFNMFNILIMNVTKYNNFYT